MCCLQATIGRLEGDGGVDRDVAWNPRGGAAASFVVWWCVVGVWVDGGERHAPVLRWARHPWALLDVSLLVPKRKKKRTLQESVFGSPG